MGDVINFKTADCCLNCESREVGMKMTHNGVFCLTHQICISGRLVCDSYKRSQRKDIRSGENKIINAVRRMLGA